MFNTFFQFQAISESTSSGVLAVSIAQIVEKFFAVTKLPDGMSLTTSKDSYLTSI